jgi:hypothetical protein
MQSQSILNIKAAKLNSEWLKRLADQYSGKYVPFKLLIVSAGEKRVTVLDATS